MANRSLGGQLGRHVDNDICSSCKSFWFDQYENLQLTPRATLQLFRLIGEQASGGRQALARTAKCPRCDAQLMLTHDMQRNVRFQYLRCPNEHGRLTPFYDFLREKDFIRPLSADQIEALRRNVQSVNCSNCGGPIDVAHASSCEHCGSPLSMLDLQQAERLIAQLQQAGNAERVIDPALPLRLEQARRQVEAAFSGFDHERSSGPDLVAAGLDMLRRWLKG
jgi:Zn-finger nucleic acid-binding protein